ncbi:MAG: hypothetical protein JNK60_15305 [Acidobacteria bacterium]|nr:hypothetical protein [Acidobacteriota bacterium]
MTFARRFHPLVLLVALAGCSDSPTEPPVHLSYQDPSWGVDVLLRNADGLETLRRAEILVDGVLLSSQRNTRNGAETTIAGNLVRLSQGNHTATIRILEQSASPSPYIVARVHLTYFVPTNSSGSSYFLTESSTNLSLPATMIATGGTVDFSFSNHLGSP